MERSKESIVDSCDLAKMFGAPVIGYTWPDSSGKPCYKQCYPVEKIAQLDKSWQGHSILKYYYIYGEHRSADLSALNDAGIPFTEDKDTALLVSRLYRPFMIKLDMKRMLVHSKGFKIYVDHKLYSEDGRTVFTDPDVAEKVSAKVMDMLPTLDFYTANAY